MENLTIYNRRGTLFYATAIFWSRLVREVVESPSLDVLGDVALMVMS